jgi:glycosyltransferase involved in cell wall biosynthesis
MNAVSVVVATRNRAGSLARTLRHLTAECPTVVVVDNGSTDDTAAVAAGFPGVRVVRLPRNRGAVARNVGVSVVDTPYVAFADDDSWWAPGSLDRAAALFRAYPRLALIAARILVGPQEAPDPMNDVMAAAPLGRPADLPGPSVLGFLACGAVVRREAFLATGGFDSVVFFMGEEERLAYDLRAGAWGLSYCDSVTAHHHPGRGKRAARKAVLSARNQALTAWMRRPLPVAGARTADFLRTVQSRSARAAFAARLPRALAARRPPNPVVEAELRRLAAVTAIPTPRSPSRR